MEKRTTKPECIQPILDSLQNLGSTTEDQLLEHTYIVVKDHLHPADHVVLSNGEPRWRYQMQHMIDGLIESGIIVKKGGLLTLCENLRS
jgi:hypothetical protein